MPGGTKVLVVSAQPPLLEGGAAGRSVGAMLAGLVASGVTVRALAPDLGGPGDPPPGVDLELVPVHPPHRGGLRGVSQRLREPVGELAATGLAERVARAAHEVAIVHLDQVEVACLGPVAGRPTLLHLHYRALADAPLGAPWQRRFRHRGELALAESGALRRYTWLLANTTEVAASLKGRHRSVSVMPLPLEPGRYPRAPLREPVAGIIGTAEWVPTATAIRRLVDDVWPRVVRAVPAARLLIAGRGTEHLTGTDPSVQVLGPVPSAAQFIQGLSVLVYPTPRGSGTKIKVLEALACGVPVVTTPAGAEGLGPNDGVLVFARAEELAAAAAALLADEAERQRRGAAAAAYFAQHHSPAAAAGALLDLYERMLRTAG